MRVVLVAGQLVARHMVIWREVRRLGVDLQIVGALQHVKAAGEWWRPEEPAWAPVHVVRPVSVPRRGQSWWYYPGLTGLIAELGPDLIHVTAEPWAVRVSQVLRTKTPVVVHSADNKYSHGGRLASTVRSRRLRRMLPQVAGLVSWNSAGLELARRYGLSSAAPTLVAPAELPDPKEFSIDEAARKAARDELGLRPGDLAVGFFGRLESEKGPLHLVRAFLDADLTEARLFLFGSGSLHGSIWKQAAQASSRIRIMGAIPLGRVPATAASMDIIVVPSTTTPEVAEQFSRVAVEAMMARTAVIASDCGALPEVIDTAGVIVREGSSGQLAAAITRLATDETARRELALRGAERVRTTYSPETIAGKILGLWSQIVPSR